MAFKKRNESSITGRVRRTCAFTAGFAAGAVLAFEGKRVARIGGDDALETGEEINEVMAAAKFAVGDGV